MSSRPSPDNLKPLQISMAGRSNAVLEYPLAVQIEDGLTA